jgi:hypothetical protein
MRLTDKITGRVKQAAGDLTGRDDPKRQSREEERKARPMTSTRGREIDIEGRSDTNNDEPAEAVRRES